MFKKLKDKIAEEVKSSPQRIQQFAQAAQAAVTSASSSISDISNNDLFSIADDETPQNSPHRHIAPSSKSSGFQDVSLGSTPSPLHSIAVDEVKDSLSPLSLTNHHHSPPGNSDSTMLNTSIYPPPSGSSRLRKLSNSSNASDVSFRLPSYESPGGMYHLQSDMESASEMEDSVSIPSQLEKVSKEQLFAAYRRSNEKYNKYRGRYTDLARHYRNLERENAKARAVLVETQDKALRRISELREQCSLEQSAKAHLESALRMELDERSLKIESLNTKIKLLQSYSGQGSVGSESKSDPQVASLSEVDLGKPHDDQNTSSNGEGTSLDPQTPLIDFSVDKKEENDAESKSSLEEIESKHSSEIHRLNDKMQKLEHLLVKCKDTIKTHKEKNSQLSTEIQIVSTQLEKKKIETEELLAKVAQLENVSAQLSESRDQEKKLKEELNTFEKKKADDISLIEKDLKLAKEEIQTLTGKIDILSKREEENVISLAENKLSVHKELETKENEIKILKDNISAANSKIKSNEAVIESLKDEVKGLEEERLKMSEQLADFDSAKDQIGNLEGKLNELRSLNSETEGRCSSLLENMKCTELQLKQEISEKLAVIDRNNFLEGRNKHFGEENSKKNKHIAELEREILDLTKNSNEKDDLSVKYQDLLREKSSMKSDYEKILGTKESLENDLNIVNSKCHELESKLEQLSIENGALTLQLEIFTNQVKCLQEEKETTEDSHKRTEEELLNLRLEYSKSKDEMHAKVTELENELVNARQNNEAEETVKKIQNESKQKLEERETELRMSYEEKLSNYEELKDLYKNLNSKQTQYEENIKHLEAALAENDRLKTDYENLLRDKNKIESNIETFVIETDILKNECKQLRSDKCNLEEKIVTLEHENIKGKSRTEALVEDIKQLQNDITAAQASHSLIVSQKNAVEEKMSLMEQHDSSKTVEADQLIIQYVAENEDIKRKSQEVHSEKDKLISEKYELVQKLKELQNELDASRSKLKEYAENNEVWQVKLSNILDENNSLEEKCGRLKQEKDTATEKMANLEQKISEFEVMKTQYEESKLETEFLNMRVSQLETNFSQASSDKNKYITEKESLQKELAHVSTARKTEIDSLREDLAKLKGDIKVLHEEKTAVQIQKDKEYLEKTQLISKIQAYEDKIKNNDQLEIEKKNLEARLSEVQDKYKNVEDSTNEELMSLQEANNGLRNKCEKLELKCSEFDSLSRSFATVESDNERMVVKIKVLEKVESEHKSMLDDLHALKSEKSKLQADIEGLQAHLTKVSKDNSQLNDRIRELEANGEVMQINFQHNLDSAPQGIDANPLDRLNMQSQITKLTEVNSQLVENVKSYENLTSKILDLERQNSILIEEKLELQDQINSSMDRHDKIAVGTAIHSDKDFELNSLRTQLREMMNEKMDLEGRFADVELMNRSGDSNLKALEQKNEKLKLTNEKLERRLDEALVSLNHIRTMEENTELEYLRNILYEYLTGPSNNNMVLAKVLAAVVKFDQRQTQLVLEREKEKQGVLGQLGLL